MTIYHQSLIIPIFHHINNGSEILQSLRLESVQKEKVFLDGIFYVDSGWFEDYLMSY